MPFYAPALISEMSIRILSCREIQLYTMVNFIRSGTVGCFLYSCITAGLPKYKAIPMEPPMKTDIGIVWKKGRYLTTQMQNFITFVKKYYDA